MANFVVNYTNRSCGQNRAVSILWNFRPKCTDWI